MKIEITTSAEELSLDDIKVGLENQMDWANNSINLQVETNSNANRNLDPTVIVAVLGIVGTGIAPLISGLLNIIKVKRELYIEIHAKDGRILKVPADTDDEKLEKLIQAMQKMEMERIEIAKR
jgi:hypothetical protein